MIIGRALVALSQGQILSAENIAITDIKQSYAEKRKVLKKNLTAPCTTISLEKMGSLFGKRGKQ